MSLTVERAERPGYHHGDLQSALLIEAKRLVAINGADHVSMREVAANVGVSPSAVYHHFPDKDSLLGELGKLVFDEMATFQEAEMAKFSGKSLAQARKRFRACGYSYVEFARNNANLFRLCFGPLCVGDHESEKNDNRAWKLLVTTLDEMTALGQVHPKIRPMAEILAWTSIHGMSMLILDGLLPVEVVDVLLDSLELTLKGVK